jgi:hypothetical protein
MSDNIMVKDTVKDTVKDYINDNLGTYIEEPWTILSSYFEGKHLRQLVRHQLESYKYRFCHNHELYLN